ncbi:LysR family transcriptional regulator [Streptomyces sp. YIM 98790]|uniref:LysR family transcriptional regulator n=1 Tax=Streptomyces sp. YIM 98790 TaxID=2689077 RepID=UPI00140C924A|nr:LysR substrate-binding domain-containing protein [Streptomyces sp. YIM 98790]
MQLHQLRYFTAVAETRHFTRAAEREHVAQPSLSQQIQALERELGAELFHRARGHITLTDAGEALLPLARRILADTETARREVQEVAQLRRGRVRLGAPPSLCAGLVPEVLRAFHDRYPGVELQIREGGSQDLVRVLADGELDLALVITPLPVQAPALVTAELLREELVVVSSPEAPPPVRGRRIRVADLRNRPLAMYRHGYDLREYTMAACRAAGFEPVLSVAGGEMDAVLGFVRAGLGVSVVPAMVAARSGLRATPFARPGLHRAISVAHRSDVSPTRAARELRRTLEERLPALAGGGTGPAGARRAGSAGAVADRAHRPDDPGVQRDGRQ